MQDSLLNQLLKISTFSVQLTHILEKISKHFSQLLSDSQSYISHHRNHYSPTIKQIERHIISLTCQNKNLLHYKYLENKINNEHCIAYIIQILGSMIQLFEESPSTISSAFITHILSHPSCYISFYAFLMLVEACPQIVTHIPYEKLTELNVRIQKQQNIFDDIQMLQSILLPNEHVFAREHLQICDKNLQNYLRAREKPKKVRYQQPPQNKKAAKPLHIKIPPLSLPLSKSINSERFSVISRQQKSNGLFDLQKLASSLGENFITVQLGCLLANKRTRQVQQYSENQTFRQHCIEKIEKIHTQRMNSSRVSLLLTGNMHYEKLSQPDHGLYQNKGPMDENSKRYYNKVFTVALNIFIRKLSFENASENYFQYLVEQKRDTLQSSSHKKLKTEPKRDRYYSEIIKLMKQIIDINVIQGWQLEESLTSHSHAQNHLKETVRFENANVFSLALKNMKSVQEISKDLMNILSLQAEKIHKYLLLNQNKSHTIFHYGFDAVFNKNQLTANSSSQFQEIDKSYFSVDNDEMLGNIQIRVNGPQKQKGPFKLPYQKKFTQAQAIQAIKINSDPILLYLSNYLQSLQESADMNHQLFYTYQKNILKTINFYLKSTLANNRVSIFYIAEYLTPLLIMIKRELLELSHPYLTSENDSDKLYSLNSLSESSGKKAIRSLTSQFNDSKNQALIFSHPELMSQFLQLITNLLQGNLNLQEQQHYSKRNKYIEKLLSSLFLKNIYFMQLLQNYTQFVFKKERVDEIIGVLNFYKKAIEVYTQGHQMGHRGRQGNSENKPLRFLYQHISSYFDSKSGCITKILNDYQGYISPSKLDDQLYGADNPEYPTQTKNKVQVILHELLLFVSSIYYIASPDNSQAQLILDEQIASFYIKYSIMGFIKLYSLLTVTELVNINNSSSKEKHQIDYILSTKESPHPSTEVNVKQIFMIDFLKILTSLSINRTQQIAKKFREYRVLEFFVREIELEFSVTENIEKYIKKAKDIEDIKIVQFQKKEEHFNPVSDSSSSIDDDEMKCMNLPLVTNNQHKKVSVPGLNLSGKLFQKGEKVEESSGSRSNGQKFNNTDQIGKKKAPFIEKLALKTEENVSHSISKVSQDELGKNKKKGYLDDMLEEIVKPKKKEEKSVAKKSNKQRKKSAKGKSIKTQNNFVSMNMDLNLNLDGLKNKTNQNELQCQETSKTYRESDASMIYETQRKIRKIYANKVLHSQSILLILSLILYKGQLDPFYCDQMPVIHGKLNVLYLLHYHLNHDSNKSILPILAQSVKKIKPYLSGQRLFKLLSNAYTDLSQYSSWTKINAGAFGVVMKAHLELDNPKQVAIKQMNFPKSIYERCVLHDIFTEITCLEMFRLEERVTKMYNYGVIDNTYVIIMKKYACSVRDWRLGSFQERQAQLFPPTLPNILALFYEILKGVKLLHEQHVTHYDIKGDNILLDFEEYSNPRQSPVPKAVFADFGVCKSFDDQKDQLDLKSRGTECIKSPQMLTLSLKNKKEADNFDRRKKIGTTRASDIWSLGCLLYELVTGEFLFNSNDWVHFFMQVTSPTQEILNHTQCQKLNNNVYLIDFLKYILIRDPQHRPSIHNIIARFENLYALLVSNPQRYASNDLRESTKVSLDDLVVKYMQAINIPEKKRRSEGRQREKSKNKGKQPGMIRTKKEKKQKTEGDFGKTGKMMSFFNPKYAGKMMKIMDDIYFCENQKYLIHYENRIRAQGITHIIVMVGANPNLSKFKVMEISLNGEPLDTLMYRVCPKVSDFLREVLLLKGKLLFVNNQSNYATNLLIFVLSYWFKCSIFETWCLINTQILSFPTFTSNNNLKTMSKMLTGLNLIQSQVDNFPKLQCICGSVTIILKKKFQEKKGELRSCRCFKKGGEKCLSQNCLRYLEFIKKRYNIVWDNLTWALINSEDLLTPIEKNQQNFESIRSSIILNSSPPLDNLKEEQQQGGYFVSSCKVCQMWMMSSREGETWIILNNLIKSYRQGIMIPNAQQQFKAKTPALNYFTLSKLHMTSQ